MRWMVSVVVVLLAVGCGGPNGIARGSKTHVLGGTIAGTGISAAGGGIAIAADREESAAPGAVLMVVGVALIAVGFGIVSAGDDEISAELAKLTSAPAMRFQPSDRIPLRPVPERRGAPPPATRAPLEPAPKPVVTSTTPSRRPL